MSKTKKWVEKKPVITIYNPKDKPYGHLSNNYFDELRIDNKIWPTVTNYILANMLKTEAYRIIIQNKRIRPFTKNINVEDKANQVIKNIEAFQGPISDTRKRQIRDDILKETSTDKMDIYELYEMYNTTEIRNILFSAVEKAYNILFTNEEYAQTLLDTGERPIEYSSTNGILGTGLSGDGENLIGKMLMQIRFNIIRQKISREIERKLEKENNDIFTAYIAYRILERLMSNGDDIGEFESMPAGKIVETYVQDKNINILYTELGIQDVDSTKEQIANMYRKNKFPDLKLEIQSPGVITSIVLKKHLRNLARQRKLEHDNIIFNTYVKYMAKRTRPDLSDADLDTVVKQLARQAPSYDKYLETKSKVIDMYNNGDMPKDLHEEINRKLSQIYIPSEEEILRAENLLSRPPSQAEVLEHKSPPSSYGGGIGSTDRDNINIMFGDDDAQKKRLKIIETLEKRTGLSRKYYMSMNMNELEKDLRYTEREKRYKIIAKRVRLTINRDLLNKYVKQLEQFKKDGHIHAYLGRTSDQISLKDVALSYAKILKSLNKGEETRKLIYKLTTVEDFQQESPQISPLEPLEEKKETPIVPDPTMVEEKNDVNTYNKDKGPPIIILRDVHHNEYKYQPFAPMYQSPIEIDGVKYPSISMYITVRLMINTGVRYTDIDRMVQGKLSVRAAITLLTGPDGRWVSIGKATNIYQTHLEESNKILKYNYMKIALDKKFKSNRELQSILLTTKDAILRWTDKHDNFLGAGTKKNPGSNQVGKYLMKLRDEIRKVWNPIYINSSTLFSYVNDDEYMKSWLFMRLTDMCGTVFMVKDYLFKHEVDEDVNSALVNMIIDKIYYPCGKLFSSVTKDSNMDPPEQFIKFVNGCKGMQFKPRGDLDNRISKLREEEHALSAEKKMKQRSREEINQFDAKQNKDLNEYVKQLSKPALSREEIEEKINDLKEEKKRLISEKKEKGEKVTKSFLKQLEAKQNIEINKLRHPLLNSQDRAKKIDEFKKEQNVERDHFMGKTETDVEKKTRMNELDTVQTAIRRLERERDNQQTAFNTQLMSVSKIYWSRLAIMIKYLFDYVKSTSTNKKVNGISFKTALTQIEISASKDTLCEKIISDEYDNCIASALINLLIGIERFKDEYADDIKMGGDELKLAASIILNRDIRHDVDEEEDEEKVLQQELVFEGGENAEFGFTDKERLAIKGRLKSINVVRGYENIDKLSKSFMTMIEKIKKFPIPQKIKRNRINFFAIQR